MADTDSMDVTSLLAPWMAQNPWDTANYGGPGQFGASMLAAAGPTPYRQPFLVGLGKGMLAGQQQALKNAQDRMGLASSTIGLQQQMAMWPLFMARLRARLAGQGGGAPTPDSTQTAPTPNPAQIGAAAAPDASSAAAGPQPGASAPQASAAPAASGMPRVPPPPWQSSLDDADLAGDLALMKGNPQGLLDAAKTRLEYSPEAQTSMAFAKSPEAQDMMLLNAAARGKNPTLAQMALTKLRTDMGTEHIGSMSGIRTYQEPDGSWTTVNPSTGLKVNDRAGASYMPGALQAFAAREAAEKGAGARATLAAETSPAGGGGGGEQPPPAPMVPPQQAPMARPVRAPAAAAAPAAPQGEVYGAAAVAQPNYVPPILAQAGAVKRAPGSTSFTALKELQEKQGADASKTVDELTEKADSGNQLIAQIQQIRAAATEYPWTGQFADLRGKFLSTLNGVGFINDQQTKELGAYQEASKIAIQLQALATKQLGSREAAQVFTTMGRSIPNLTMSQNGLEKVTAYMEGSARYNMAMATFAQRLAQQGNVGGAQSVENVFVAKSNPSFYIMAAAPADVREEFLTGLGKNRNAFIQQWNQAYRLGLAPKPGEYEGM